MFWQIKEASVTIGAQKTVCSAYCGATPTPKAGLTGQVVYVGNGTLADFIAAGDVTGKIVLADMNPINYVPDWVANQAAHLGAKAVIMTTKIGQITKFELATDLGGGCAVGMQTDVPWVYMARADADTLKAEVAAGR